jgi:uncharacterized Fe-S center protein
LKSNNGKCEEIIIVSKVCFFDYSKEVDVLNGIGSLLKESTLIQLTPKGGSVAVKLHMGELGNITYIRPAFVRRVVDSVKEAGGKPFVTDTTALYPGERDTADKYLNTAAYNGFVEDSVGAPVVIADGDGDEGTSVSIESAVKGCNLKEVQIASRIYDAQFLLVLSHVKGHMLTGIGGAMKNLAMGCVTKKTKMAQHAVNRPAFDESKCDRCGLCVESCPAGAISLENGEIKQDLKKCVHCSTCLFECPDGAWFWRKGVKEQLQIYVAHAASGVLRRFEGKVGFINFIQDVTPQCDCAAPSGRPIVQDVGILASLDPVAIDKASLDLVDRAPVVVSPAPPEPPDILGQMHETDSLVQLRVAQKLGLGSLDYQLVTV